MDKLLSGMQNLADTHKVVELMGLLKGYIVNGRSNPERLGKSLSLGLIWQEVEWVKHLK